MRNLASESLSQEEYHVKPILDKAKSLTSQGSALVTAHRCSCHSSWCPTCFKKTAKIQISRHLRDMEWKKVRHFVLTVDRDMFENAPSAFFFLTATRAVANLVWNLRRTADLRVFNWLWVLEFHKDGFPHWHVIIETERGEMIGGDKIRKYWKFGRWVKESYFQSEEHWDRFSGYFEKKGYFEKGKGYQSRLPEWAVKGTARIRRFGSMVLPKIDEEKITKAVNYRPERVDMETGEINPRDTYEVIFKKCGAYTFVDINGGTWSRGYLIDIPYSRFKETFSGSFVDGEGYLICMTPAEVGPLIEVCEKHRKMSARKGGDANDSQPGR